MTREAWLSAHPDLQGAAEVSQLVDDTAASLTANVGAVDFQDYLSDFHAGVPLLYSDRVPIDLPDPREVVHSMLAQLPAAHLPSTFGARCRALHVQLSARADPMVPDALGNVPEPSAHARLFRYLLWAVLRRNLQSLVNAFAAWRNEERWLRNYCPTCGATPAMGQLVGKDPGRLRLLSCGCCGTRWRYRPTGCPFCDTTDDHRVPALVVEEESGLRLDYCEVCRGYLKTYAGEGDESLLLADWASLHLDALARERGFQRLAASLYEV